jgi:hypothetical protein
MPKKTDPLKKLAPPKLPAVRNKNMERDQSLATRKANSVGKKKSK